MTTPPPMPSRATLVDFAAANAARHRVEGPTVRRLMRLIARYRKGIDEGPALDSLHAAIHQTLPRAAIVFAGQDVFVDGHPVP